MGKKRPSRKMLISIDLMTGRAMLIDGYQRVIEADVQTVMEKLGVDAEDFFKEVIRVRGRW